MDAHSPLADPGMRLAVALLDAFIPIPALAIAAVGVALSSSAVVMVGFGLFALVFAVMLPLNLLWLHRYGQSIGKRLLGLRIVRRNNSRVSLARIVGLRIVPMAILTSTPVLGPAFYLLDGAFTFSPQRRCVHDMFADTIVVDVRRTKR